MEVQIAEAEQGNKLCDLVEYTEADRKVNHGQDQR